MKYTRDLKKFHFQEESSILAGVLNRDSTVNTCYYGYVSGAL